MWVLSHPRENGATNALVQRFIGPSRVKSREQYSRELSESSVRNKFWRESFQKIKEKNFASAAPETPGTTLPGEHVVTCTFFTRPRTPRPRRSTSSNAYGTTYWNNVAANSAEVGAAASLAVFGLAGICTASVGTAGGLAGRPAWPCDGR